MQEQEQPGMIAGFREEKVELLEQTGIIRVNAAEGKVYAATEKGDFQLRLRLSVKWRGDLCIKAVCGKNQAGTGNITHVFE